MLLCALTIAVSLLNVCRGADIADFDNTKSGYEFIFHDDKNLVLTTKDQNCYYIPLADEDEVRLTEEKNLFGLAPSARELTEGYVIRQIESHSDYFESTTLEAMRLKYQDLLADYHCAGKQIFEFVLKDREGGQEQGGHSGEKRQCAFYECYRHADQCNNCHH